jgi:transcriptional regulator with XRE-family HTH domain
MSKKNHVITPGNINETGAALMEIRMKQGVSQSALAELMGKAQSFVSGFERKDVVKVPSLPTVVNCLDKLGYELVITKKKQ